MHHSPPPPLPATSPDEYNYCSFLFHWRLDANPNINTAGGFRPLHPLINFSFVCATRKVAKENAPRWAFVQDFPGLRNSPVGFARTGSDSPRPPPREILHSLTPKGPQRREKRQHDTSHCMLMQFRSFSSYMLHPPQRSRRPALENGWAFIQGAPWAPMRRVFFRE